MANIEMITRLLLIIQKLDRPGKCVPGEELLDYLEENMQLRYGRSDGYSIRTIQRDIRNIDDLFGIVIRNKKDKGYYIDDKEQASAERYEELLLNFDILTALNAESGLRQYVLAEHHRPVGSGNLAPLMGAIRNKHCVEFNYTLYRHDNAVIHKKVAPHFLKESRQRWYLLAMDGDKLKTFGIERIADLHILVDEPFVRDESIDGEALFRDSFGIWDQEDIPVEDVVLSYDALDGKFLKSVPLHHSQSVLTDTDKEFRIKVRLRITNDFVIELLSRSRSLTVIEPLSLRERIRDIYEHAIKRHL